MKRINDVVYRIHKELNGKLRVFHFNRLAPYAGSNDIDVQAVRSQDDFDEFMVIYTGSSKACFGIIHEDRWDLFQLSSIY